MGLSLTTLGVSSASPTNDRFPSAHVLQVRGRLFLIDCGEAAQMLVIRNRISLLKVSDICISHLHGDHVFGIFGLLSTMSMKGRTAPLTIYAPKAFADILGFYRNSFGDWLQYETRHVPIDSEGLHRIGADENLEFFSFPLNHSFPAWGFLFREKALLRNISKDVIAPLELSVQEIQTLKEGKDVSRPDGSVLSWEKLTYQSQKPRSFAYCCDTAPFSEEASYIDGVDLLLHEATFAGDLAEMAAKTGHSTTLQAARVAADAHAGRMVITHFSSRYPDPSLLLKEARSIFPETELAEEGRVFEIR